MNGCKKGNERGLGDGFETWALEDWKRNVKNFSQEQWSIFLNEESCKRLRKLIGLKSWEILSWIQDQNWDVNWGIWNGQLWCIGMSEGEDSRNWWIQWEAIERMRGGREQELKEWAKTWIQSNWREARREGERQEDLKAFEGILNRNAMRGEDFQGIQNWDQKVEMASTGGLKVWINWVLKEKNNPEIQKWASGVWSRVGYKGIRRAIGANDIERLKLYYEWWDGMEFGEEGWTTTGMWSIPREEMERLKVGSREDFVRKRRELWNWWIETIVSNPRIPKAKKEMQEYARRLEAGLQKKGKNMSFILEEEEHKAGIQVAYGMMSVYDSKMQEDWVERVRVELERQMLKGALQEKNKQ